MSAAYLDCSWRARNNVMEIHRDSLQTGMKGVVGICKADMARTFEFVLHFVGCVTVTVSPNQIISIIVIKVRLFYSQNWQGCCVLPLQIPGRYHENFVEHMFVLGM